VEVKNLNSFRAVLNSLGYEMERQRVILQSGGKIEQETMGWDEVRGVTVPQRSKEYAHDYRYFPEPDLPPLELKREWIESIKARLPELPDAKRERFIQEYGLSKYDAGVLTAERAVAGYFEECLKYYPHPKEASNWVTGEIFRLLKSDGIEIERSKVHPVHLGELLELVGEGTISSTMAKEVLEESFKTGQEPRALVESKGLVQISDADQLATVVDQVLEDNPKPVADYLGGKEGALRYLVGQVMKATKGKANPSLANRLLKERLKEKKG